MMGREGDRIRRALGYPYEVPPYSYLFDAGYVVPIESADFEGRVPVLAYGSNAAPEQLIRKFGTTPGTLLPVTRASVQGIDVVYAALLATYGSVPATIHDSAGTEVFVHVTWLDAPQLAAMHESEGEGSVYRYGSFPVDRVVFRDASSPERVYVYVANSGALGPAPLALSSVPARGRNFPDADQREAQRRAQATLSPALDDGLFVAENVANAAVRAERSAALRKIAVPPRVSGFTPLS